MAKGREPAAILRNGRMSPVARELAKLSVFFELLP